MIKCTLLLLFVIFGALCDTHVSEKLSGEGTRHKRLLFYDEDGNLVKTYKNPYLQDLALHVDKYPSYGNFLNPFFAFIRASYGGALAAFAIPVSSEVVEQIQNDPIYQHKLVLTPKKDPIVAPNTLCEGKRAQVPSKNCNNFLNCWDGWAFEQECPEGLLFSGEGFCDYAHNVNCQNREILHKPSIPQPVQPAVPQAPVQIQPQPPSQPQPPAQQPQPPVPTQPQPPSHPQPPVQTQPEPQPQPQPPAQAHPPVQAQPPVQPQPVPCQQPQPQPPQVPPQPPQLMPQPPQPPQPPQYHPQAVCNQDFESFINKYNCNEFFVCVNRQPVKFQCPADLAYSEYLGVCDYPDRVGCLASTPPQSMRTPTLRPTSVAAISTKPAFISPEFFVNYESHMSDSYIAMSRQDAVRQLQGIK